MQKYIQNDTGNTMFVGGSMIPPGEGRMVEVADVAQAPAEQDDGPSLDEVIAELLEKSVAQVVETLEAATYEALDRMAALEAEGGNRKTLLAAIGNEQIRRADLAIAQADQATDPA